MHRSAGIFRRDEKVRLARFLVGQKRVAGVVYAQSSGDEVRRIRQHVSVLSNSRDLTCLLELS